MTTREGRLIVFEGADGVGKSRLAQWFAEQVQTTAEDCRLLSFPGKEPGTLGLHVYDLHHDPKKFGICDLSETSLQLLHIAAHIDAIETLIKPLLKTGCTVVLDRFWWSTYVYGIVGGIPAATLDSMIAIERAAWLPVRPSRVFLIARNEPLRPEPMHLWPRWQREYFALAQTEASTCPVTVVNNDGELNQTQERIIEAYGA
jgi:thymidylate kinase